MKIGLCLTGGGAKGAFQAGVIKGLYEKGIYPKVVTGTSIGAINGYFMMKDAMDELESFWTDMDKDSFEIKIGRTMDNSSVIDYLSTLEGDNKTIANMYVNYVAVKNRALSEVVEDIKHVKKERALECVKYSSLLPSRPVSINTEEMLKNFNSSVLFENFKEDVALGVYEGYGLDGGILNNNLLMPLVDNNVDKLIVIGLRDDYVLPEYLYKYYNEENMTLIRPDIKIMPSDTIRFEKEFLRDMMQRGYNISKKLF